MYNIEYKIIWIWNHCDRYYPCKPTLKNEEVEFRTNASDKKNVSMVGYKLRGANLANVNRFECLGKGHRETYEVRVQHESCKTQIHIRLDEHYFMRNFIQSDFILASFCWQLQLFVTAIQKLHQKRIVILLRVQILS